jgi:hypothetical protein
MKWLFSLIFVGMRQDFMMAGVRQCQRSHSTISPNHFCNATPRPSRSLSTSTHRSVPEAFPSPADLKGRRLIIKYANRIQKNLHLGLLLGINARV